MPDSYVTSTLAWASVTVDTTTPYSTSWEAITYNAAETTFTHSSPYFGYCDVSATTSCNVWMYCAEDTSSSRGTLWNSVDARTATGSSGPLYCASDLMLKSLGASEGLRWVGLVGAKEATRKTFYFTSPPASEGTSSSTTTTSSTNPSPTSSNNPSSTSSSIPSSTSSSIPSSTSSVSALTPNPAPNKSNIGVIAGAAVGGVAVLAAIMFGIIFLLRRRRPHGNSRSQAGVSASETLPPQSPPTMPQSPSYGHATPMSPAPSYVHPYGANEKSSGMGYGQGGHGQDTYAAHHHPPQEISEMAGSAAVNTGQSSAVSEMPVSKQ